MDIPDLESIDPFPILAAVVGVLIALLHDDLQDEGKHKSDKSVITNWFASLCVCTCICFNMQLSFVIYKISM